MLQFASESKHNSINVHHRHTKSCEVRRRLWFLCRVSATTSKLNAVAIEILIGNKI